jgi:predicted acyl esterase
MQWLTLVAGRTSQDKLSSKNDAFWGKRFRRWFEAGRAFNEIDAFFGLPSVTLQEWLSHPYQDAYWDAFNPTTEQYAKLTLPILTITGACDGDQLGALMHYKLHQQIRLS